MPTPDNQPPQAESVVTFPAGQWQYQARAEPVLTPAPAPTVPDYGWFVQWQERVVRRHQVDEGLAVRGFVNAELRPLFEWFVQHPEHTPRALRPNVPEGYYATAVEAELIEIDLDFFLQHPEQVFRKPHVPYRPHVVVQGWYVRGPVPTEFPVDTAVGPVASETTLVFPRHYLIFPGRAAPPQQPPTLTFSAADWPFLALVNPNDFPTGVQFRLVVVMDTNNAAFPAYARLYNITDGAAVLGSVISTAAVHGAGEGTLVRSIPLSLPSGAKEYQVQRGGESGSGATVHLHKAWLVRTAS